MPPPHPNHLFAAAPEMYREGEGVFIFDHDPACILTLEDVELATQRFLSDQRSQSPHRDGTAKNLLAAPQTAEIEVLYSGAWTTEAIESFEFAVSIWERLITSSVPIIVEAQYTPLGAGVLGLARPTAFVINNPDLPDPSRYYPIALANHLAETDFQPELSDIQAAFNSQFNWYLGTDGNPPATQLDFVSVVLHELAHGLGFAGNMQVGTLGNVTVGSYTQFPGQPLIYDHFSEDLNGRAILSIPDFSRELAAVLTSNNVYFDGPRANEGNNGARVRLYAPSNWSNGSSYSHLDETFRNTPQELMVFSLARGNGILYPGSVTVGLLADIGWPTVRGPQPNFPALMLEVGESLENRIFLPDFVYDALDPGTASYSLSSQTGSSVVASLFNGNQLALTAGDGTGTSEIFINVTNTAGISTVSEITVFVVGEKREIFAPLMAAP